MKQFMPELSERDRIIVLRENAYSVEQTTYMRPLSEEEIADRKNTLTKNSIELYDIEEQKKEAVKVFKEKIDPLKAENRGLLFEIRTKQVKAEGELFNMMNEVEGTMETYDHEGNFIASRRLRPNERQLAIPMRKVAGE